MNDDDMLGRIAVGAGLEKDEADRVTRAFFRILETRLGNEEAQELAPTDPDVEELTFEEFLNRMADAAGIENARQAGRPCRLAGPERGGPGGPAGRY